MLDFFKRKSGVDIVTGFKLHSSQLLDARQNVDTIEERDALVRELQMTKGGLRVFVEETKKSYIFNGATWDEVGGLSAKLATVALTGSYQDLKDKPEFPSLPTLAAIATSGDYNDLSNKPTSLPADGGTAQTISDTLPISKGGTGATTFAEATNNLFALSIKPQVSIPSNSNLDDYIDCGTYRVIAASVAQTITNSPVTGNGFMLVVINPYGNENNYRLQRAIVYNGATYSRYRNVDGNWSVWTQHKYTDTVYTHPTTAGNKHIPAGGSSGQVLKWSAAGTAAWSSDTATSCPSGTVLFSTRSTTTFFNACFGGTWEIIGYVDALVASTTIKLYAFKKK